MRKFTLAAVVSFVALASTYLAASYVQLYWLGQLPPHTSEAGREFKAVVAWLPLTTLALVVIHLTALLCCREIVRRASVRTVVVTSAVAPSLALLLFFVWPRLGDLESFVDGLRIVAVFGAATVAGLFVAHRLLHSHGQRLDA